MTIDKRFDKAKAEMLVSKLPTPAILWVIFFCYATIMALLFQKLVLPLMPSLHAGQGLLAHDAAFFHSVAVSLADAIHNDGWQSWKLWPQPPAAMGNVGLLAALYVLFGPDPSLIIPVNAAIHASSGLLIYFLARRLWPGWVGIYAGTIAACLFVMFPSALNWYGQVHKDGYATLGLLLVLYAWIRYIDQPGRWRDGLWLIFGNLAGVLLMAGVRPYSLFLLLIAVIALIAGMVAFRVFMDPSRQRVGYAGYTIVALALVASGAIVSAKFVPTVAAQAAQAAQAAYSESPFSSQQDCPDYKSWRWEASAVLPEQLERYVKAAATARVSMICSAYTAGSLVDRDRAPTDILSVLAYLPRGLEIALLAPFPSAWFHSMSAARLVGALETAIWYLLIPGVVLALYYRRSPPIVLALLFALVFLVIYGFTTANVGTLHRIRYPYLFVFIVVGTLGWVRFFLRKSEERSEAGLEEGDVAMPGAGEVEEAGMPTSLKEMTAGLSRRSVTGAGLIVAGLTAISYLGFFVRDIAMARWFGLGSTLDVFFIAMMLPMFFVNMLCIPFGAAVIPVFMELRERTAGVLHEVVAGWSFLVNGVLVLLCVGLYLLSPILLPLMGWGADPEKIGQTLDIMLLSLPILFFSGMIVLGNSLLNASGKLALPALLQAVVPLFAIAVLLLFGHKFGVISVAAGMLLGQVVNLIFVAAAIRKNGISLYPRWPKSTCAIRAVLPQFVVLAGSALFLNAAIVVDSVMASSLDSGSVGALNLGNKVVLFLTGVIGTGMATVMLPYFSAFMAQRRVIEMRRELSLFLFLATLLSIPVAIAVYLISEDLVRLAFHGGLFDSHSVTTVSRVVKFGIIQLPFFACNILLLKFAAASRHNGLIILASIAGLCLNVILNFVLMKHMGVAGIALATTLSMMASAALLLILAFKLRHVEGVDLVVILLAWLLFLTLVLCLHYRSYPGVVVTVLALLLLVAGSWRKFFRFTSFAVPRID